MSLARHRSHGLPFAAEPQPSSALNIFASASGRIWRRHRRRDLGRTAATPPSRGNAPPYQTSTRGIWMCSELDCSHCFRQQRPSSDAARDGLVVSGLSFALSPFKKRCHRGATKFKIPSTRLGSFSLESRNTRDIGPKRGSGLIQRKRKTPMKQGNKNEIDAEIDANIKKKVGRPKKPEGPKMKSQDSRCSPTAIADIFLKLRGSKDHTKYREVEDMGFGCLKHIPNWKMKQDLAVALVRSYNNDQMSMVLETGDVPITAPLIGSALGLPAKGDSFKKLDENVHGNLIITYEGMTIKKLEELVIQCSVSTDA
ncbi:hypothetical protein PIB30_037493 [Stylosanthes scabra]|uniref:Uncharacterized protein n=1 Tax=Stylosanthes scabra TaxID=79078 RepID=A0ABU6XF94_9FABA|nr:hypothetical protein [Stylosanthes scabra]